MPNRVPTNASVYVQALRALRARQLSISLPELREQLDGARNDNDGTDPDLDELVQRVVGLFQQKADVREGPIDLANRPPRQQHQGPTDASPYVEQLLALGRRAFGDKLSISILELCLQADYAFNGNGGRDADLRQLVSRMVGVLQSKAERHGWFDGRKGPMDLANWRSRQLGPLRPGATLSGFGQLDPLAPQDEEGYSMLETGPVLSVDGDLAHTEEGTYRPYAMNDGYAQEVAHWHPGQFDANTPVATFFLSDHGE